MKENELRLLIAAHLQLAPEEFEIVRMFGRTLVIWRVKDWHPGLPEEARWGMARVFIGKGQIVRLDAI